MTGNRAAWSGRRIALVDALRGAALIGMIGYHLSWDLGYFRFIDGAIPLSPPFKAYANVVASTFLVLVGISLVLAREAGSGPSQALRRLSIIALAAAAVSLVTWYVFPENFIFFGILHCIVVSSVLATPFVRAPSWLAALAVMACIALPALVASPAFDPPYFWWLGLGTRAPATFDYRPLFPWLGAVLAGVVVAKTVLAAAGKSPWLGWSPKSRPGKVLAWGGRHSLAIYLVHQPLLVGLLFVIAQVTGAGQESGSASFMRACETQCVGNGSDEVSCRAACACVFAELRTQGLWARALTRELSKDENDQIATITRGCTPKPMEDPVP